MGGAPARKSEHREWRKKLKKMQRQRKRQKMAKERDKAIEDEEATKRNDPTYLEYMQQQLELEEFQRLAEERKFVEEEEAWMRRELIAQRQFRLEQKQRDADAAAQEVIRSQQQKEFEEREMAQQKQREEKQRKAAAAAAEFERAMQRLEEYLANPELEEPEELQRTAETKPGHKLCEFYERTNCCRFGFPCMFNHRRPFLSRIILIRHFFTHPLLEQYDHGEYAGAEAMLEIDEHELREYYDAFFDDVVPEMETFGKIVNFRTVRNAHNHLRGNVFVEFTEKRNALNAFINLQGRYYATKRLNVEFSNLVTWRGAICGISLSRKCPKGLNCCYLHLFRNPGNKYNTSLEFTKTSGGSSRNTTPVNSTPVAKATPILSWNDDSNCNGSDKPRNWRWSESPEMELESNSKSTKRSLTPQHNSNDRESNRKTSSNYNAHSSRSRRPRSKSREHYHTGPNPHRKRREERSSREDHNSQDRSNHSESNAYKSSHHKKHKHNNLSKRSD